MATAHLIIFSIKCFFIREGGGAVGWAPVLQGGRSRVRFAMVSLEFFTDNPSGLTMAMGPTRPLTEMSRRSISWKVRAAGAYGWQPYHFVCLMSRILRNSTSRNPQGLRYLWCIYIGYCTYIHTFRRDDASLNYQQLLEAPIIFLYVC
jgi:hypothetical protein